MPICRRDAYVLKVRRNISSSCTYLYQLDNVEPYNQLTTDYIAYDASNKIIFDFLQTNDLQLKCSSFHNIKNRSRFVYCTIASDILLHKNKSFELLLTIIVNEVLEYNKNLQLSTYREQFILFYIKQTVMKL